MTRAGPTNALPSKVCRSCGRTITWRKAWARTWDEIRYCSDTCRQRRLTPTDDKLAEAILTMLGARAAGASMCPSEAAKAVGGVDWHEQMEPARAAARRLVADGVVQITQAGRVVDPSTARGPIRLRLASRVVEPELIRSRSREDTDR